MIQLGSLLVQISRPIKCALQWQVLCQGFSSLNWFKEIWLEESALVKLLLLCALLGILSQKLRPPLVGGICPCNLLILCCFLNPLDCEPASHHLHQSQHDLDRQNITQFYHHDISFFLEKIENYGDDYHDGEYDNFDIILINLMNMTSLM